MRFTQFINEEKEVAKIDYWYDKSEKSWVVQKKDKGGNQIGYADYVYTKKEATDLAAQYEKEIKK
jgi:hypothetical protein